MTGVQTCALPIFIFLFPSHDTSGVVYFGTFDELLEFFKLPDQDFNDAVEVMQKNERIRSTSLLPCKTSNIKLYRARWG